jgi:hypothetical protein
MPPEDWSRIRRRQFLAGSGLSLGAIALGGLLNESRAQPPRNPLAARRSHFAARAKHVISLHMIGAAGR